VPEYDHPDLKTLCSRNDIEDLRQLGRALFVAAPAALLDAIRAQGTFPTHFVVEILLPRRIEQSTEPKGVAGASAVERPTAADLSAPASTS
jgi:hypothetical protein